MIEEAASQAEATEPAFAAGLLLAATGLALAPLAKASTNAIVPVRPVFFARWGFSHVASAILVGVFVLFLASGLAGGGFLGGLYASVATMGAIACIACLYAVRLHPERLRALGFEREGNVRSVLAGLLAYVLLVPAMAGLTMLWPTVARAIDIEVAPQEVLARIQALEGPALWQAAVLAVLVAPLVEEVVFRGFLQPLLVQNLHEVGGVCVTSFLFAALHGASAFLPLFALSALLGGVQLRTRRIAAAYVVHGTHNAVILYLAFQHPESLP